MNFNKITVGQLLLILGLITLLLPPILTRQSFCHFFNFSNTGEIGDTIGGITAPFINVIGAILVFIAFKEQVKANDLIKEQQYFQHIQEQVQRLEDDFFDLPGIISGINQDILNSRRTMNNFTNNIQVSYHIDGAKLNKAIYTTVLFKQTVDLIDEMEHNKYFMKNKIKILYKILYQDNYLQLDSSLKAIMHMKSNSTLYVTELLFQIKDLENKFADN